MVRSRPKRRPTSTMRRARDSKFLPEPYESKVNPRDSKGQTRPRVSSQSGWTSADARIEDSSCQNSHMRRSLREPSRTGQVSVDSPPQISHGRRLSYVSSQSGSNSADVSFKGLKRRQSYVRRISRGSLQTERESVSTSKRDSSRNYSSHARHHGASVSGRTSAVASFEDSSHRRSRVRRYSRGFSQKERSSVSESVEDSSHQRSKVRQYSYASDSSNSGGRSWDSLEVLGGLPCDGKARSQRDSHRYFVDQHMRKPQPEEGSKSDRVRNQRNSGHIPNDQYTPRIQPEIVRVDDTSRDKAHYQRHSFHYAPSEEQRSQRGFPRDSPHDEVHNQRHSSHPHNGQYKPRLQTESLAVDYDGYSVRPTCSGLETHRRTSTSLAFESRDDLDNESQDAVLPDVIIVAESLEDSGVVTDTGNDPSSLGCTNPFAARVDGCVCANSGMLIADNVEARSVYGTVGNIGSESTTRFLEVSPGGHAGDIPEEPKNTTVDRSSAWYLFCNPVIDTYTLFESVLIACLSPCKPESTSAEATVFSVQISPTNEVVQGGDKVIQEEDVPTDKISLGAQSLGFSKGKSVHNIHEVQETGNMETAPLQGNSSSRKKANGAQNFARLRRSLGMVYKQKTKRSRPEQKAHTNSGEKTIKSSPKDGPSLSLEPVEDSFVEDRQAPDEAAISSEISNVNKKSSRQTSLSLTGDASNSTCDVQKELILPNRQRKRGALFAKTLSRVIARRSLNRRISHKIRVLEVKRENAVQSEEAQKITGECLEDKTASKSNQSEEAQKITGECLKGKTASKPNQKEDEVNVESEHNSVLQASSSDVHVEAESELVSGSEQQSGIDQDDVQTQATLSEGSSNGSDNDNKNIIEAFVLSSHIPPNSETTTTIDSESTLSESNEANTSMLCPSASESPSADISLDHTAKAYCIIVQPPAKQATCMLAQTEQSIDKSSCSFGNRLFSRMPSLKSKTKATALGAAMMFSTPQSVTMSGSDLYINETIGSAFSTEEEHNNGKDIDDQPVDDVSKGHSFDGRFHESHSLDSDSVSLKHFSETSSKATPTEQIAALFAPSSGSTKHINIEAIENPAEPMPITVAASIDKENSNDISIGDLPKVSIKASLRKRISFGSSLLHRMSLNQKPVNSPDCLPDDEITLSSSLQDAHYNEIKGLVSSNMSGNSESWNEISASTGSSSSGANNTISIATEDVTVPNGFDAANHRAVSFEDTATADNSKLLGLPPLYPNSTFNTEAMI